MNLCGLPTEVFRVILEQVVVTVGIPHAVRLRLVCKVFNNEISSAICSTSLLEDDPRGARVPPEFGLIQEYLFRLSLNANKGTKDLPTVISQIVTYLLLKTSIKENLSGSRESYTRKLCQAAVAFLYTESPEYLRYPPARNNSESLLDGFACYSTDIFAAVAILGIEDIFVDLCRDGFDSAESSTYFGNPLVLAASHNNYKITKSLLYGDHKSTAGDLKPMVDQECRALKAAARAGHADIVQLILENQSIYKATKDVCQDALIEAIKGGHTHIANWLVSYRNIHMEAPMWEKLLETATSYGHERIVQETLRCWVDLLSCECINTALSQAAAKGYSGIAQLLISHGANPNQKGNNNYRPLTRAAAGGYRVMAQILLESGADINAGIWKPVDAAVSHGQDEMFSFLMEAGADVSHLKHNSANVLSQAASGGYETMIRTLITLGVDIKATGTGAVLNAILEGHRNIVELLTEHGAQEPQSRALVEILHKSAREGYERWVLNLIAHGLDVSSPHPVAGCPPLYWANREGHSILGRKLVKLGATPIRWKGRPQVVGYVQRVPPFIL